jgi:hypothetical protein
LPWSGNSVEGLGFYEITRPFALRTLGPQVRENGEYTAMVVGSRGDAELPEDVVSVALHRLRAEEERLADPAVRATLCHQGEDLSLPWCQLLERIVSPTPSEQLADDVRVHRRTARSDSVDRLDEVVDRE